MSGLRPVSARRAPAEGGRAARVGDDIESNPAELRDNQLGLGVYLSSSDKDDDECGSIDTTKERSLSIIKEQTNNKLFGLGLFLIIGGISLIIVDLSISR